MEIADQRWRAAIGDSAFAPPDDGFADRLRAIAAAAEGEAAVLHEAAPAPELRWNPVPRTPVANGLSYELRPGGNRPGPGELWDEFDQVVDTVSDAQAGDDFAAIGDAFRRLGDVATRLAAVINAERSDNAGHAQTQRRGAA